MPRLVDHERSRMIKLCEYGVCENAVRDETVLMSTEKTARGRVNNLSRSINLLASKATRTPPEQCQPPKRLAHRRWRVEPLSVATSTCRTFTSDAQDVRR